MKLKINHLFYLLVLVVATSVYYFDYYKGEEKEKQKDKEAILIPILKDEVTAVQLKNGKGDFEINKTETGWSFSKPISDMADTDETNSWIQSITTDKSIEKIGEGETFEWSTYGLDKPAETLIVTAKSGKKVQLQISSLKSIDGDPFIKRDEEKIVYVGNSVWLAHGEKSIKELRDKRLIRENLNELESVGIFQGKTELKFSLKEGRWIGVSQPQWVLDQTKTREIVNIGRELKALEYVLENDPTPAEMNTMGFIKTNLKLTYYLKDGKTSTLELSEDKNKVWHAWAKNINKVAKVDSQSVQKLLKAQLIELRDREVPFNFNKEDVKKLNIITDNKLELSKEGDKWKASVPGTVEESEVTQFLERLKQLRVSEFMDGKTSAPGLDSSQKQFVLADQTGKNLWDLKIGNSFKRKENKSEITYFYVKSSHYPDAFVLKGEDLAKLSTDKLIKKEESISKQKERSLKEGSTENNSEIKNGKEVKTQ